MRSFAQPYIETATEEDCQASLLINALFGKHFESHDAYIALAWRQPGQPRLHHEFFSDLYFLNQRIESLKIEKVDTYFAVAPLTRPSRRKSFIRHVLTLHVDADGHSKDTERKIRRLNPTAIVRSGSKFNFHPYFFLENPVRVPQKLQLVEELNRRLAVEMGIEPKSTFDITRILRVPGTFNLKNPKIPRPVELIEFQPSVRYPLDYFVERFHIDANDRRFNSEKPTSENDESGKRGHFLSPEERAYIEHLLRVGLFEPNSRNHAMLLLVRHCHEQNFSKSEAESYIINFFVNHHNNLSKDWLKNPQSCVEKIRYSIENWWRKAYKTRGSLPSQEHLSVRDQKQVQALRLDESDAQFLINALTYILRNKHDNVIVLSARQLQGLPNVHSRNWQQKLKMLERLGIIRLKAEAKPRSRLAREYEVLFSFSDSRMGEPDIEYKTTTERIIELLLSGADTAEIRSQIPDASRQRILYHSKRLAQATQFNQFFED